MQKPHEDFELTLFDRLEVIRKTVEKYGEDQFYISFSGGGDSTVLSYMVDEALPGNKIPRVFINTGIEYADITKYVLDIAHEDDRFHLILPKTNIQEMLKREGYPFKSKEHSAKVELWHKNPDKPCITLQKYITENGRFACPKCLKYQFTPKFNLKVSSKCCNRLKKDPLREWAKTHHRPVAIIGLRSAEGGQRARHVGCVTFKNGNLKFFKPLNPLSNEFMDWYIETRHIRLCRLYYPPFNFKRTGCKGCPYSIDLQKQLDVMEELLPFEKIQCETIWKPVYDEYRRIGYRLRKDEGND